MKITFHGPLAMAIGAMIYLDNHWLSGLCVGAGAIMLLDNVADLVRRT